MRSHGLRVLASLLVLAILAGVLLSIPHSIPAPAVVQHQSAHVEIVAIPQKPAVAPPAAEPPKQAVADSRKAAPSAAPDKPVAAPEPVVARAVESGPLTPPAAAVVQSPIEASVEPPMPGDAGTHTETYTAQRGDSLPALAHRYLSRTEFLTSADLETALRAANPDFHGNFLRPGETIQIPAVENSAVAERPQPVSRDFEVRGVYLTGVMAGSEKGMRIVRQWRQIGGNAVVFDIKDSDGTVNIPVQHPLAPSAHGHAIPNLAKYMRWLHSMGMHGIARIAIFRDEDLVRRHPELAVRSRRTGQPWRENGKLVWTDPSREEVQQYDIALAKAAIAGGADEVQFDYVRFPAEGDQKDAQFVFETEHPGWKRADVIADFLSKAYAQIHPHGVLFSLDVFGVMAWQRDVDLSHTGQDIVRMAKFCDVLSPMIYPSHFFGMDGYALPGDAPEHFISESMERFHKITTGSGVVLRPWLQAFAWRTRTYSPQYVVTQVVAAKATGGIGFLFWNARNDYSKPVLAMVQMRQAPGKFFRGDEVRTAPSATAPAGAPSPATSSPAAQLSTDPPGRPLPRP